MGESRKTIVKSPKAIGNNQKCKESVSELMKYRSLEEEVEAIISILPKTKIEDYPIPHITNANVYAGFHTQVQKLLSPPRKRVFQHLREELSETAYKSYWNRVLGRTPDQVPNLPVGMNPETTVFGRPSKKTEEELTNTVSNVVFPKMRYGEVELEYELGLNLYRRSHKHYLPGQKTDHYYDAPDDVIFGDIGEYDKRGTSAKHSLEWFVQSNTTKTSKRLAKFKEKTHAPIGQALAPNKNILAVGLDHTFGIKSLAGPGARDSMRYGPVNNGQYVMGKTISYISSLRNKLKKRVVPFPFSELLANFKLLDEESCCCLPLSKVYNLCNSFGLFFDNEIFEEVLKKMAILHGENNDIVSYYTFCNLLDYTKPFPLLPKIDDIPDELKCYETTYQTLSNDHKKIQDCRSLTTAGVPTLRTDRKAPQHGRCRVETELLDGNGIDSCIRPSIFTSYGLHPRDFLELKSKDYMKDLWKRVGVTIPNEVFEMMWNEALTREENDAEKNMVCIETFRNILDEMSAAKLNEMQET